MFHTQYLELIKRANAFHQLVKDGAKNNRLRHFWLIVKDWGASSILYGEAIAEGMTDFSKR